jgi:hypothetical protein
LKADQGRGATSWHKSTGMASNSVI